MVSFTSRHRFSAERIGFSEGFLAFIRRFFGSSKGYFPFSKGYFADIKGFSGLSNGFWDLSKGKTAFPFFDDFCLPEGCGNGSAPHKHISCFVECARCRRRRKNMQMRDAAFRGFILRC